MAGNQVPYSESQYIELKKYIGQGILSTAEQYDKAILALSGGAFGVSIAFLKDIAPAFEEGTRCWLIIAWVAFVAAICSSLTSFLVSISAFRYLEEFVDARQGSPQTAPTTFKQSRNDITTGLNILSLTCFVVGAISLASFSFKNVPNKESHMPKETQIPPAAQKQALGPRELEAAAVTMTPPVAVMAQDLNGYLRADPQTPCYGGTTIIAPVAMGNPQVQESVRPDGPRETRGAPTVVPPIPTNTPAAAPPAPAVPQQGQSDTPKTNK